MQPTLETSARAALACDGIEPKLATIDENARRAASFTSRDLADVASLAMSRSRKPAP